ncbi:S-layer homology domain-containing protein [Bacillus sp. FJAT-26390]|uniref:S-layer homology domain-containing protein n=1 Tax=Bacillus sp. FJAT-26390 TaxID=1743142 RepID=UPI0009E5E9F3
MKRTDAGFTFSDVTGHWAEAAVSATVEKGIVQGIGANKFAPNQTATRAQAPVILLRALELAGN